MNPAPKTIKELQACVAEFSPLAVRGAGTKTALSSNHPNAVDLDLSRLRGILEYDPSEFTFTALAGTPITDIQTALAENGQYLPFDPPFATEGATLGGTVAAGLSGPRRPRTRRADA